MGSGGREIGQALARELQIDYYDKELLYEAAKNAGLAPELFERCDEKTPSALGRVMPMAHGFGTFCFYGSTQTSITDDGLYRTISEYLNELAANNSFLVVGRSADYVLRAHPELVSIFIAAPMADCIKRIMARSPRPISVKEAKNIAEKTNKLRAEYYNFYTDRTWGEAASYDLCINSSALPMQATVNLLARFVLDKLNH